MGNIKRFDEFINENKKDDADFVRVRSIVDDFVMPGGKLDDKKFQYLMDLYGETCAIMNDPGDDDAFFDCTQKHQMFDYFPYENCPKRDAKSAKLWKSTNDISTVIAAMVNGEKEQGEELTKSIAKYKGGPTRKGKEDEEEKPAEYKPIRWTAANIKLAKEGKPIPGHMSAAELKKRRK